MKKFFALLVAACISVSAHAANYKEGEQYKELSTPKSKSPQVTEFFSFYCPHCYNFEPVIEKLKDHLPANVEFQKNHVDFMGGDMGLSMSKAYATMVVMNVEDKMIPVMFNQIHQLRQAPKNEAELKQIFTDHGIDGKKFDAEYNSFAVDSMARRFSKSFKDHGLTGVPSVVVNNKYLVVAQGIKTMDEYYDLIDYLLKK